MIKDNRKGISPQEISTIKDKVNCLFLNNQAFTLIFSKGKSRQEKTCTVCGVYPSMFRVKTEMETLSINYVDLLTGSVYFAN